MSDSKPLTERYIMGRVYCVKFEGDDRYHTPIDGPRLIAICDTFDLCEQAINIHANAFRTNDREPLEFVSRGIAHVQYGFYFISPMNINELPDYSMRTN